MTNPIIERIQREAGIPELIDVLAERLDPTDLQSLLLEVYRRRATRVKPGHLLDRYERDRFVRPSAVAPSVLTEFDRLAWSLLPREYTAVELSPLCPLGTNAAIATVDQNKVVSTIRNNEVVADSTNVLALECAARRRQLLRVNPQNRDRIRLAASHRLVRGQAYRSATALAHFRLFGLCTAGRDEGSFQFETTSLVEQIGFYLRLLGEASQIGCQVARLRVAVTDLEQGQRERALSQQVLEPLRAAHQGVTCAFDPERESGRGYYVGACFNVYATNLAGSEFQLVDGGFTTWTQQLLSNRKERLLVGGMGTERFCGQFATLAGSVESTNTARTSSTKT